MKIFLQHPSVSPQASIAQPNPNTKTTAPQAPEPKLCISPDRIEAEFDTQIIPSCHLYYIYYFRHPSTRDGGKLRVFWFGGRVGGTAHRFRPANLSVRYCQCSQRQKTIREGKKPGMGTILRGACPWSRYNLGSMGPTRERGKKVHDEGVGQCALLVYVHGSFTLGMMQETW